jgi:hypothetical protein
MSPVFKGLTNVVTTSEKNAEMVLQASVGRVGFVLVKYLVEAA